MANIDECATKKTNAENNDILMDVIVNKEKIDEYSKLFKKAKENNMLSILNDNDTSVLLLNVKKRDKNGGLKWYNLMVAFDNVSKNVVNNKLLSHFDQKGVRDFIQQYFNPILELYRPIYMNKDSNTPFELIDNKICIKTTGEVLIDINIEKVKNDVDNFIREIVEDTTDSNKVDGNEIPKKEGYPSALEYVFFNKNKIEEKAKDMGYKPQTLFKEMHNRGMIYVTYGTKLRYYRRTRCNKIVKKMGMNKLFGIKKDILNRYKEVEKNENI